MAETQPVCHASRPAKFWRTGWMNQRNQMNPINAKKSPKTAILGLFLAFVPALIFLSLKDKPWGNYGNTFWVACGVSIVCCFVSSSMLLRHRAVWAILVGILFFALNAVISFLLGCGAVLNS
jgi:hypothetical protein